MCVIEKNNLSLYTYIKNLIKQPFLTLKPMKLRQIATALFIACLPGCFYAHAGANEDAVLAVVNTYKPGTCALGNVVVNKVTISTPARTITVDCSEATAYIHFTSET